MYRTLNAGRRATLLTAVALFCFSSGAALGDVVQHVQLASAGQPSDTADCHSGTLDPEYRRPAVHSSADGRYVAFASCSTDLVAGQIDTAALGSDTSFNDVFLHDRQTQQTSLVSHTHDSLLVATGQNAYPAGISADGRWILFLSDAAALSAPGLDTNNTRDVYLHDRETGANTLVSRVAGGTAASAQTSREASMSADGRFVVYSNRGRDVVAGMQNPCFCPQVYLYDRNTGINELISVSAVQAVRAGESRSGVARVSPDGRFVSFSSLARDLLSVATTGQSENLFVRDRQSQTTLLASRRNGNPVSTAGITRVLTEFDDLPPNFQINSKPAPIISTSGAVYFTSAAADIVADDLPGTDVYAFNVLDQTTRRISRAHGEPTRSADGESTFTTLSGSGRWVLFDSAAGDLVEGQTQTASPVIASYLHDTQTGNTSVVTRAATDASRPVMAQAHLLDHDATHVLFESVHVNELTGAAALDGDLHAFAFERSAGTVRLLSHVSGAALVPGRFGANAAALSGDGAHAFMIAKDRWYDATLLDLNRQTDVYEYSLAGTSAKVRSRASQNLPTTANGETVSRGISDDGRWVVLETLSGNFLSTVSDDNDGSDVYLLDAVSGQHQLLSRSTDSADVAASGSSMAQGISADGRLTLLRSNAPNLVTGISGSAGFQQLFLHDRNTVQLRQLTLGSENTSSNGSVSNALISRDGQWVAYSSTATNLVAGAQDSNADLDVFLHELGSGQIRLVSRAHGTADAANAASTLIALSGDGRWLLYASRASNLSPATNTSAYYLYDRVQDVSSFVADDIFSTKAISMSDDGRWVLLESGQRLDPQFLYFGGFAQHIFLHDMHSGTSQLISRSHQPGMFAPASGNLARAISADGQRILFDSDATDLIAGGTPTVFGLRSYVFDQQSGRIALLSRRESPYTLFSSQGVQLSADGQYAYLTETLFSSGSLRTHLDSGQQLNVGGGIGRGGEASAVSADNRHIAVDTDAAPAVTTHRDSNRGPDVYLSTIEPSTQRSWLSITHTTPQPSAPGAPITVHVRVQGDTPPTDGQVEVQGGTGCLDTSGTPDGQGGLLFSCELTLNNAGIEPITARYLGSATLDPSHTLERYPHSVAGFDFSSLPISYGTRLSDNGPRHGTPSALFLGSRPATPENDGPSNDASDDQQLGHSTLPGMLRNQTVTYALTASGPGFVNGFVDFNRNGQFDLPFEQWLVDVPVQRGKNNVSLAVPLNVAIGTAATRFRLSSVAGLNHLGPAPDGEVEDGSVSLLNNFPVVAPLGTPMLLEDSSLNLVVTVSDPDAAPGALVLTMTSLSPQLLFGTTVLNGATPNQRIVQIQPFADANGTGTIRLTLRDPEGLLVFESLGVNVQPVNDAPSFSISGNIRHPDGSSGPRQRVGFANNFVMGPANEASQQVQSFAISRLHDPDDVVDAISLQNDGTLSYELSGAPGTAVFEAVLIDNGGTANGGVDTSTPALFTISVEQTADLAVSIDNGRNTDLIPGELLVYDIRVRNLGPSAAVGMALINNVPDGLGDVSWTCTAQAPAQCLQASGNGGILLGLSNLPAGSELLYRSTGRVTGGAGTRVTNQAQLLFPVHVVDTVSANNTAIDDDLISADVLMRDGFE